MTAGHIIVGVLAACFGVAAVVVGVRRYTRPAAVLVAIALSTTFALIGDIRGGPTGSWHDIRTFALMVLPALGLVLALGLPDGRMSRPRTVVALGGLLGCGIAGVLVGGTVSLPLAVCCTVAGTAAVIGYTLRCRRATPLERARLQWVGWAVVVSASVAGAVATLDALVRWPRQPGVWALATVVLLPVALVLASFDTIAVRIDRLLVSTVTAGAVTALVGIVYVLVVLGLGGSPATNSERTMLGLSMVAAALATVLVLSLRAQLDEFAHRRVYGERRSPDEALQTFGSRMSRAIPMDELLLQLVESLRKSMALSAAEVWTGGEGTLERVVSVPVRPTDRFVLEGEALPVASRARVSGNAWLQVWIPALLAGRGEANLRVAPMTHSGALLGLIVAERDENAKPFTDEEERVLGELARQVALALHNVRLDSALQASLDDLRVANEELRASRARIVAAADQSRRQIERNLHDGAQQHLVALAVKLGLARQLLDSDPATVATLLEELRSDAQTTLTELRELAHGIYPPLLMDRGLPEALRAAANRCVLPTDVAAEVGRYNAETEAAVYFCCLEAMQNAGKYAGANARVAIAVEQSDSRLRFTVSDDGAGFESKGMAPGHGFINMTDRLGAIGGSLEIDSSPGAGTRIIGSIPVVNLD
jgi:signal transduction histidine kinase